MESADDIQIGGICIPSPALALERERFLAVATFAQRTWAPSDCEIRRPGQASQRRSYKYIAAGPCTIVGCDVGVCTDSRAFRLESANDIQIGGELYSLPWQYFYLSFFCRCNVKWKICILTFCRCNMKWVCLHLHGHTRVVLVSSRWHVFTLARKRSAEAVGDQN